MKISTVALWSVALWSSGTWSAAAYATSELESPESKPLPNLSSDNEAALPFVSLETLPSELETAIALEPSISDQDVIEWSPALEAPAEINTLELELESVETHESPAAIAQVAAVSHDSGDVGLNAIAPTMPEDSALQPIEWSSATSSVSSIPPIDTIGSEVQTDTASIAKGNVAMDSSETNDVAALGGLDDTEASSALTTQALNPHLPQENATKSAGSDSISSSGMDLEEKNESGLTDARAVEDGLIGFAPASSEILEVAQLSSASFPDISRHWARDFIDPLENNGVVEGFPDGTFKPDMTLTRAEFAALLDQSFVLSPIRSSPNFVDVPSTHWANDAIDSAYRSGFISGQSSTRFAPEQSLTRADTLTALANGLSLTPSANADPLSDYFDDSAQIPAYAQRAIAAAVENEMVVNYPQTRRLRPNDNTTRAEATAFLYQALAHLDAIPELDSSVLAAQYIVMPDMPSLVAQASEDRPLTEAEIEAVRQSLNGILDSIDLDQIDAQRNSSPAITISNPSGFGADNFTGFANFSYQSRTRFANQDDGTAGIGVGFGDAQENVGLQLSYTVASFGGSRDFGSGGFNAKLHRQLPDRWGVALGWEGFLNVGGDNDFEDTIYGSISKIIETREDVTAPLSRIAISAGLGNGRFRTEEDFEEENDVISPFGSVAFLLAPPVTSIVEWTGQDLAAGLSIAPFKDFPLVITPAVRDITGAGDGARFIISSGLSWQF